MEFKAIARPSVETAIEAQKRLNDEANSLDDECEKLVNADRVFSKIEEISRISCRGWVEYK